MNKVILVGRITKDPELKYTTNNIPYTQFTTAVNRTYQDKNGERQADFISCVAWRQQAENFARYMRKGSLIGVEGQIQTRNYDDANGVRRYVTEVICDRIHFLEPRSASRGDNFGSYPEMNQTRQYDSSPSNDYTSNKQSPERNKNPFEDIDSDFDISNDDLPF